MEYIFAKVHKFIKNSLRKDGCMNMYGKGTTLEIIVIYKIFDLMVKI